MARIRTIRPEFPQSESMGRVSREARLLFILMWTIADDSGRLRGSSRMLASLLYPYDDDAPKKIGGWIADLQKERCLVCYEVEGDTYIQISNWLKHQKIDRPSPSRIPAIDEGSTMPREDSRVIDEDSSEEGKGKEGRGALASVPLVELPTAEHQSLAATLGVSCQAEWSKFCDWSKAKGRRHKDAGAAFNNWLRKAAEYAVRDGVVPIHAGPSKRVAL